MQISRAEIMSAGCAHGSSGRGSGRSRRRLSSGRQSSSRNIAVPTTNVTGRTQPDVTNTSDRPDRQTLPIVPGGTVDASAPDPVPGVMHGRRCTPRRTETAITAAPSSTGSATTRQTRGDGASGATRPGSSGCPARSACVPCGAGSGDGRPSDGEPGDVSAASFPAADISADGRRGGSSAGGTAGGGNTGSPGDVTRHQRRPSPTQ